MAMANVSRRDLVAGTPFQQTSTNSAVALTAASLLSSNGNRAAAILIACATQTVRIAFGTPVQGAAGLGQDIAALESVFIEGPASIKSIKIISAANNSHGVLTVTPFFEPGR
jgi:hypothetical protein